MGQPTFGSCGRSGWRTGPGRGTSPPRVATLASDGGGGPRGALAREPARPRPPPLLPVPRTPVAGHSQCQRRAPGPEGLPRRSWRPCQWAQPLPRTPGHRPSASGGLPVPTVGRPPETQQWVLGRMGRPQGMGSDPRVHALRASPRVRSGPPVGGPSRQAGKNAALLPAARCAHTRGDSTPRNPTAGRVAHGLCLVHSH